MQTLRDQLTAQANEQRRLAAAEARAQEKVAELQALLDASDTEKRALAVQLDKANIDCEELRKQARRGTRTHTRACIRKCTCTFTCMRVHSARTCTHAPPQARDAWEARDALLREIGELRTLKEQFNRALESLEEALRQKGYLEAQLGELASIKQQNEELKIELDDTKRYEESSDHYDHRLPTTTATTATTTCYY